MKRALSVLLSSVVLITAPGIGAFQAAAQVISPVSVSIPVAGANAGAAGAAIQTRVGLTAAPNLTPILPVTAGILSSIQTLPANLPVIGGEWRSIQSLAPAAASARTAASIPVAASLLRVETASPGTIAQASSAQATEHRAGLASALSAFAASHGARAAADPEGDSLQTVRGQKNQLGGRFRQLRALFGARDAGELPSGGEAAAVQGTEGKAASGLAPASAASAQAVAPAVETPAKPEEPKKGWGGLNRGTWWFISSLLAQQMGVEALGSAMPALIQKAFGDFTIYAQVAVVSSVFGIIGRQIAPVIIEKVGLKTAYVGSYLLRVASITALCALLATGHMTLPLMYIFYSANALIMGTTFTAMNSVPPLLVGQEDAPLNRFWGMTQMLSEIFGVLGPILTGVVIASFGFMPALAAFPIMTLAAALILWMTLKVPDTKDVKKAQDGAAKPAGFIGVFKEFGRKVAHGAKIVWSNPSLRLSFIAYTLFLMLNPFLYQMLAPGYALRIIGTAAPELAPAISGWLTGLYSAGGLLGGIVMTMQSHKLGKAKESGQIGDAEEKAILHKSMLRWILLAAGSLAFIASMAVPLPVLGSLVALPSFLLWAKDLTLPALALIPFGISQVVAQLKLQSFFQARVPKQDVADAMGFLGSASLAVTTLGILGLKFLFKAFPLGLTPFYYFSLALIPVALFALYLRWRLSKQS